MTEGTKTQRFFEDGTYFSQQNMATLIKSLLTDGYIPLFGNGLAVKATSPISMSVTVDTGMAVVQGYIVELEGGVKTLPIAAAHASLARIDRVIARLEPNATVRGITFAVKTGTPAATPAAPELTKTAALWELPLAQVKVAAGSIAIAQSAITDERPKALNSATGLPAATKSALGVVKVGAGITLSNGEISVPHSSFPMVAKMTQTDAGLGILIKNNTYNGVLGCEPAGVSISNKNIGVKECKYTIVVENTDQTISGYCTVSYCAKNLFTTETRVVGSEQKFIPRAPSSHSPSIVTFTATHQIRYEETCYYTLTIDSSMLRPGVRSVSYEGTNIYLTRVD